MDEIENVKQQIDDLPKGSITKKVIQGKDRYYLQWREADKVKTRYVKLSELPELSTQIEKRIALQQKLVELQVASIQYNVDTPAKMAAENGVVYDFQNTDYHNPASIITELTSAPNMQLADLAIAINKVCSLSSQSACNAINQALTIRNWLIGQYIVVFEQNGKDRAKYGDGLLKKLEQKVNARGLNVTLLQLCRQFYLYYPEFSDLIYATSSHKLPQFKHTAKQILTSMSFSHIRECMTVENLQARYFYESECIKGVWSVRELRRQISTSLYERSALSRVPQKLLGEVSKKAESQSFNIRDPFTFEFLDLPAKNIVNENDLENELINHLQDFILELGKGFCFEARQKRMIIDDRYFFADMVFYNRLLHCGVIVELKNDEFKHEYLGQLNAYVSYYKEHEMQPGDNPPVGILLCTRKGKKMVEYATAGLDNKLFVSTYKLKLPSKKELELFLKGEDIL